MVLSVLFAASACSSNDKGSPTAGKEYQDGIVNQMNGAMFTKMIWDFNKNPDQWVFNGDRPCIIDFYADWCRPCKMVAPIMDDLAKTYHGKIRIFRVNTDEERELASRFNISSIPAVLFIPAQGKPQMAIGAQSRDNYIKAIGDILQIK
jgi:thioredoxin